MYYHVWFLTKYRKATLDGKIERFVKDIFAECITRHKYRVIELETNRDHVHVLVEVADRTELSAMIRTLKAVSAKKVLDKVPHLRVKNKGHFWAKRYGYRGIDKREIGNVRQYIRNQKEKN